MSRENKYEIDMCNGSIMDKLVSFSLPLMLIWNPAVNVQCSGYHRRRSDYSGSEVSCGSWFNDCADCCFYELIYWNIPWCQCA